MSDNDSKTNSLVARGRPKQVLSPEEIAIKAERRRIQLVEAQARRRKKLKVALLKAGSLEEAEKSRDYWYTTLTREIEEKSAEIKSLKAKLEKAKNKHKPPPPPNTHERAALLFENISRGRTWRDDRPYDRNAHSTREETDKLSKMLRKARTTSTSLKQIQQEFKDLLTENERLGIEEARLHLSRFSDALDIAKDRGRMLTDQRKKFEEAMEASADQAVREVFAEETLTAESRVLLGLWICPNEYVAKQIVSGESLKRECRGWDGKMQLKDDLASDIDALRRDALNELKDKVRRTVNAPKEAAGAALALHANFKAARPQLRAQHGQLLQRINTELVARQLERTTKRPE